jgi:DNA-binding transcriptional MerR regulator
MSTEATLTIEELASRAGTATTTVRMYQSKGLLPPPERRGRIGYYGQGHLARLRLIAQLQEQGFSLASIKQLTDAWESGRSLDDILGLETQVTAWAPEEPRKLTLAEFRELFTGRMTPAAMRRASGMGLIEIHGLSVTVKSPRLLQVGLRLLRAGVPMNELLDELETLQEMAGTIATRFTGVFERTMWQPFVEAGLPAGQVRPLTESLQELAALAEDVVNAVLRDALRARAGEFLARQARHLDSAGMREELGPIARAAGLEL